MGGEWGEGARELHAAVEQHKDMSECIVPAFPAPNCLLLLAKRVVIKGVKLSGI